MEMCDSGHNEIVFEGNCPLCKEIDKVTSLEGDVEALEEEAKGKLDVPFRITTAEEQMKWERLMTIYSNLSEQDLRGLEVKYG